MATSFIDYMIADQTVIPDDHRTHYSERIIALPDCYLAGSDPPTIASERLRRADHSLPEDAVVLCCFNSLHKLTPSVFAIWMRILRAVDNTILWLFASKEGAQTNLQEAAKKAGVDPGRLIFATRVPNAQHLARHRLADLSIDTAPYNAHTTANDALWAGLPVVTRIGEQVASRVAASLLTAAELPELITHTDAEYEALIIELATDHDKRGAIREKLAAARSTAPLFDTARYTRHLEAGFDAAYARFMKGLPPADIAVET